MVLDDGTVRLADGDSGKGRAVLWGAFGDAESGSRQGGCGQLELARLRAFALRNASHMRRLPLVVDDMSNFKLGCVVCTTCSCPLQLPSPHLEATSSC